MHSILRREPTTEERKRIAQLRRPDFASYGCMIALSLGPIWLLGLLGGWIGSFASEEGSSVGCWIGWGIGLIPPIILIASFRRYDKRQRKLAEEDDRASTVEEIRVLNPNVVEINFLGNNGPILAFDIGESKILFLQGQWLEHHQTYGQQEPGSEEYEDFFNGLDAPASFPSTEFIVTRFPHSGEVISIEVLGNYLTPTEQIDAMKPEYEFQPSEVLDGQLNQIADVLATAHNIKQRTPIKPGLASGQ